MNVQKVSCADDALLAGDILIGRVRGVNILTSIALSVLAILGTVLEKAPQIFELLTKSIQQLNVWTSILHLYSRIKEWVSVASVLSDPKKKANPQGIAATTALTAYSIFMTTESMHYASLINLGSAISPITLLHRVTAMCFYALDFWDNVNQLTVLQESSVKLTRCLERWQACKEASNKGTSLAARKVNLMVFAKNRLAEVKPTDRTPDSDASNFVPLEKSQQARMHIWNELSQDKINLTKVRDYIDKKIVKFETKLANDSLANKKAWIGIAVDVTAFAAFVLVMILPLIVVSTSIITTLSILTITATVADLVRYFTTNFFLSKPVAPTPLPNLKPQLVSS